MFLILKELALADPRADVLLSPFDLLVNQSRKIHKSKSLLLLTFDATVELFDANKLPL